jgi:hypothetical protein
MQIRKTYREINPDLLYNEIKDFTLKQGASLGQTKIETYSLPTDSSSFITRGTLTFKFLDESTKTEKECCQVHIVGSARGETKLMLDIDEKLFAKEKITGLLEDIDFILSSYEVKPR